MAKFQYECNGRMVIFEGTEKQMKAFICNLFGTYFWNVRVINGNKWFLFGHVEVRKVS